MHEVGPSASQRLDSQYAHTALLTAIHLKVYHINKKLFGSDFHSYIIVTNIHLMDGSIYLPVWHLH